MRVPIFSGIDSETLPSRQGARWLAESRWLQFEVRASAPIRDVVERAAAIRARIYLELHEQEKAVSQ